MGAENSEKTANGSCGTETFVLLKRKGMRDLSVSVRQCTEEDLNDIIELQRKVHDAVIVKDTFVFSTQEELAESLMSDICIGAYLNGRLIAFTLVLTNPYSPRNLGYYLNYTQEQCLGCVTYDTTFVHPEYTGYGIQKVFISMKDELARAIGAIEALATVSPENTVSLNNLEANGFKIADEKKMYGERHRYIMRKSLI